MHAYVNIFLKKMIFSVQNAVFFIRSEHYAKTQIKITAEKCRTDNKPQMKISGNSSAFKLAIPDIGVMLGLEMISS